jgi:hypothetical protein
VLPDFAASKLQFLSNHGIKFGAWLGNIQGDMSMPFLIFAGLVLILLFKNSMEKMDSFTPNKKIAFMTAFLLSFGILSLTKVSEFLYFNF